MPHQNYNITAFGEILWDVYPDRKHLGGAPFNFIYHIWKILGSAKFISSVGDDNYGLEIINHLRSIGFNTRSINVDKIHATGTVKVVLDENKIPKFTPTYNCSYDFIQMDDSARQTIFAETDLFYFGTFSARSHTTKDTLLSLLGKPNVKYFCDLNLRHNFYTSELVEQALLSANVVKINEEELSKLKNMFNLPLDSFEACKILIDGFNIEMLGFTLGRNGAYIFDKTNCSYYKSEPAEIIDTLGAGDAFSAILCLGYLHRLPLEEINKLANTFALQICKTHGAFPSDDSIYKKLKGVFKLDN